MKILTLILFFILPTVIFAQLKDENTLLINEYFQIVNNNLAVKTQTKPNTIIQSYVNLKQTGNENSIYISSLQKGDQQVVNQIGNLNNYKYYNYYSKENSNLKVSQVGKQNSLQVFGENSLMKDAVIYQKSNFKSMTIKNYTR